MAKAARRKSTIVRVLTANLRAAEYVAPRGASRWVTDQWFRLPPGPRPADLPPDGTPFVVTWEHGDIRGHTWGEGPVVYLVHGWGGRGHQFSELVEPLVRAGYRAVLFDAPSHGESDPGAFGPTSTTGVEFGKALDAVFGEFGPGEAVVAHSMGVLATLLSLNFGWLGVNRLVFVAPMSGYAATMDGFQAMLGFGRRTRRHVDKRVWKRVGLGPDQFDVLNLWAGLEQPLPVLVVHDRTDPQTPYDDARLISRGIGAELMTTTGLGHNRVLADPRVIDRIVAFLGQGSTRLATGLATRLATRLGEPEVTLPATA